MKLTLAVMAALAANVALSAPALAKQDRRVTIINDTSQPMIHFYASNVGEKSWQEDILGKDTLDPGESVVVNIDDGTGFCNYDLKAVFKGGGEAIREKLNVCKTQSWTVHDE